MYGHKILLTCYSRVIADMTSDLVELESCPDAYNYVYVIRMTLDRVRARTITHKARKYF